MIAIKLPKTKHGCAVEPVGLRVFAKSKTGEWFEIGDVFSIEQNISPGDDFISAKITIPICTTKQAEINASEE